MSLLSKLEGFYLNLLRIVILVLATVLLVGGVTAAIYAAPKLVPSGPDANARHLVSGDGLDDYRRSQRGEAPQPSQVASDATSAGDQGKIDDRIKNAAAILVQIANQTRGQQIAQAGVEKFIAAKQAQLPASLQGDYADSLLHLLQALKTSPDRTIDIDQLIEWHFGRFAAAQEEAARQDLARAAEHAARVQSAIVAAEAALAMFGLFLLLVFSFVLVKIERNLRLLSVTIKDKI